MALIIAITLPIHFFYSAPLFFRCQSLVDARRGGANKNLHADRLNKFIEIQRFDQLYLNEFLEGKLSKEKRSIEGLLTFLMQGNAYEAKVWSAMFGTQIPSHLVTPELHGVKLSFNTRMRQLAHKELSRLSADIKDLDWKKNFSKQDRSDWLAARVHRLHFQIFNQNTISLSPTQVIPIWSYGKQIASTSNQTLALGLIRLGQMKSTKKFQQSLAKKSLNLQSFVGWKNISQLFLNLPLVFLDPTFSISIVTAGTSRVIAQSPQFDAALKVLEKGVLSKNLEPFNRLVKKRHSLEKTAALLMLTYLGSLAFDFIQNWDEFEEGINIDLEWEKIARISVLLPLRVELTVREQRDFDKMLLTLLSLQPSLENEDSWVNLLNFSMQEIKWSTEERKFIDQFIKNSSLSWKQFCCLKVDPRKANNKKLEDLKLIGQIFADQQQQEIQRVEAQLNPLFASTRNVSKRIALEKQQRLAEIEIELQRPGITKEETLSLQVKKWAILYLAINKEARAVQGEERVQLKRLAIDYIIKRLEAKIALLEIKIQSSTRGEEIVTLQAQREELLSQLAEKQSYFKQLSL